MPSLHPRFSPQVRGDLPVSSTETSSGVDSASDFQSALWEVITCQPDIQLAENEIFSRGSLTGKS